MGDLGERKGDGKGEAAPYQADAHDIPDTLSYPTDPTLTERLRRGDATSPPGRDSIAVTASYKHRLWTATGGAAIDLESVRSPVPPPVHGLPFAVLRAICDPAGRNLPPAALTALNSQGTIGLLRVIASLLRRPGNFQD